MPSRELHKGASRRDRAVGKGEPASKLKELARRLPRNATFRRQFVRCGKSDCRRLHGPYWYAFWKEQGRTRSAYIGREERFAELLAHRQGV